MINALEEIDHLKSLLDTLRPLPPSVVAEMKQRNDVRFSYNSTAIEGNTLTQNETALVLQDGLTIGGKRLSEHLEIVGHKQAIDYIETLAAKDEPVGEWQIRQLHQLIMYGNRQDAGRYRTVNVMAAGSGYKYPDQLQVPELMAQFEQWLSASEKHPVIKAAEAHYRFVSIHPFSDGNGRAARLLQNLLLLQNGYPPITLLVSDRAHYIDSLFQAQTNNDDLSNFLDLVCKRQMDALKETLEVAATSGELMDKKPKACKRALDALRD